MSQKNDNLKNQNLSPNNNREAANNTNVSEGLKSKIFIKNKFILIPLILLAIIALSAMAYFFVVNKESVIDVAVNKYTDKQADKDKRIDDSMWKFSLIKPVFAQIEEIVSKIKPSIPLSKIKISEIENLESFAKEENIQFSETQKQTLENDGFFLGYNNIIKDQSAWRDMDDFVDIYDSFDGNSNQYYRKQNNAIFISSDAALHLYHILVDRSFQKIEETKFQPMLRSMARALFLDSINKYNSTDNKNLKESYKRLSTYYLIPLVILDAGNDSSRVDLKPEEYDTFAQYLDAVDNQMIVNSEKDLEFSLDNKVYNEIELSDEIYNLAKSELELIQKASGKGPSPLFTPYRPEFENDYSQFKPRSHYTKNDILKSYFIAMMWYGRMGFVLKSPELTREALIMTGQINNLKVGEEELSKMWSNMSVVIDFFVGEVDDSTAYQYTDLIKEVYGDDNVLDKDFTDDEKLDEFIKKAKEELPLPKILSEVIIMSDYDAKTKEELLAETLQFRFMGQRFTPDAYIINKLTQGDEAPDTETGQKLPTMPTALMPLNIIAPDNQVVKNYLDEWVNDPIRIQKQNRQSDKIIAKVINRLKQEFFQYVPTVWTQNIYWSWLNCFKPLLAKYGDGYPYFMQTDNWLKKNLGTVFGSFTELKHDTLLYAKQSYAELGGGGDNPPELPPAVKGYVEPDLTFWNRIITLAETTERGLKDRNVFPQEFEYKYKAFIDSAIFFKQIAEQELQNQKISDDDFEKLRTISLNLRQVVSPIGNQELTEKEKRAGIIADIHTDAIHEQVLYEATGKPFIIYAVVKDTNGARLTRGAVFNHYEFTDSLDERLSDEDWQTKVYDGQGQLPAGDKWSIELIK